MPSWFKRAEAEDAKEERDFQAKDELPDWVKSKQRRLEKIKEAKAALENEAREPPDDDEIRRGARRSLGRPTTRPSATIFRATPTEVSADAGYCSEENLAVLERRRIRGYVSTGRKRHKDSQTTRGLRPPKAGSRVAAMDARLKRGGWSTRYRRRKCTVEPVFGQIKDAGFRQLHLRGVDGVRGEWSLLCTAHNLLKLAASRRCTPTPARRSAPRPGTPAVDGGRARALTNPARRLELPLHQLPNHHGRTMIFHRARPSVDGTG